MAVSITIVGQGTVQQATAAVSESFRPSVSAIMSYTGTAYTLTATPAVGWRFAGWTYSHRFTQRDSSDAGATWTIVSRQTQTVAVQGNPAASNIQPGVSAWVPDPYLFEGDNLMDYSPSAQYHDQRIKITWDELTITATFEPAPVGPGPILRSDAGVILRSDAGVILHQG